MSDFYTITRPRAQKAYRCEECRGDIPAGERYARHSGKQEGYVFTVTICLRCHGMRSAAWELPGERWCTDEGPVFGELRVWLQEEHGIADPEAWYDGVLAEKKAQSELQAILGAALQNYQAGTP